MVCHSLGLILLSALHLKLLAHTFVLHSVLSYSTTTGHLKLAHNYPQGTNVTAVVDANLILESLSHEHTRVGEWVNILGYVGGKQRVVGEGLLVHIQGLMLWPTGPLDVQRYERTFENS